MPELALVVLLATMPVQVNPVQANLPPLAPVGVVLTGAAANVLKTRHDISFNAIRNIR